MTDPRANRGTGRDRKKWDKNYTQIKWAKPGKKENEVKRDHRKRA